MKAAEVKKSIIESFNENNNPHAFLVSTNSLDRCFEDVYEIVKEVNCTGSHNIECSCPSCKLINMKSSPDVIIIEPSGKEIKVVSIEELIRSFATKPLINKYQVYIIKEADKLSVSSANKLLKFLEEPNPGIVGFLLTNNTGKILPTIRSRCTLYNFDYEFTNLLSLLDISESTFDKFYNETQQLIYTLENEKKYKLMLYLKTMAKKERNDILEILNLSLKIYSIKFENILHSCYNKFEFLDQIVGSITTEDELLLTSKIENINEAIKLIDRNGNRDLTLSRLAVVWK